MGTRADTADVSGVQRYRAFADGSRPASASITARWVSGCKVLASALMTFALSSIDETISVKSPINFAVIYSGYY